MFTRCPKCRTAYRVDPRSLRDDQAEALCDRCNTVFDALAFLAVTVKEAEPEPVRLLNPPAGAEDPGTGREGREASGRAAVPPGREMAAADRRYPWRLWFSRESLRWGGGALALFLLLLIQIFAFEGKRLSQNIHIRPLLEGVCSTLGCALPPFRDVDRLQIMDRTLNMAANSKSGFEFSLVFANQSALPQAFPRLKLVLNELTGKPVAERVFEPIEYLPDWREDLLMPIGNLFEVRLAIAKPSRDVGGFTIEFQ